MEKPAVDGRGSPSSALGEVVSDTGFGLRGDVEERVGGEVSTGWSSWEVVPGRAVIDSMTSWSVVADSVESIWAVDPELMVVAGAGLVEEVLML